MLEREAYSYVPPLRSDSLFLRFTTVAWGVTHTHEKENRWNGAERGAVGIIMCPFGFGSCDILAERHKTVPMKYKKPYPVSSNPSSFPATDG